MQLGDTLADRVTVIVYIWELKYRLLSCVARKQSEGQQNCPNYSQFDFENGISNSEVDIISQNLCLI